MKNTTFVSAGAGSGKTYRLTQDIARMVKDGTCKAEEIILTTFTEVAAQELKEKVRATLYAEGLYEAAKNLDSAAIGTIHSIAYQFVSRYWYLLGISANASIMDSTASAFFKNQSLSSLPSDEDIDFFQKVFKTFDVKTAEDGINEANPFFWKKDLERLIDTTIESCISKEGLEKAKDETNELLAEVFEWSGNDISGDLIDNILANVSPMIDLIVSRPRVDKDKKTREFENKLKPLTTFDKNQEYLPIKKIYSIAYEFSSLNTNYILKNCSIELDNLAKVVREISRSNQVKEILEKYVETIFNLTIKWKTEYENFKRERCILDFGDLLLKFDQLLAHPEVEAEIKSRYKIVFVDEYQDCSPLQVKSFNRLSELMEKSIWVGDIKQAIYGFRVTNTELIKKVITEVGEKRNGNNLDSLEHCWRSNSTIINLVNKVFCEKVFTDLDKKLVELKQPERKPTDPATPKEKELMHWHFKGSNKDQRNRGLVERVKEFIDSGAYKTNEIAIIYKDNKGIEDCTKLLKENGIPFNVKLSDGTSNDADEISIFINAVISFASNERNELSKAIVVNRIMEGYNVGKLLSGRMRYLEKEEKGVWLSELDIISDFNRLRKVINNQSVASAVETIIVELNLVDLIKRINPDVPTYNYCAALSARATAYEGMCNNLGLSSTLVGFAEELKRKPINNPGDDNGVTVLTYHKSKGLEWPCVILCSLDSKVDESKIFYGVETLNTADNVLLRLFPRVAEGICKGKTLKDFDFFREKKKATIEEFKRLMYVGMTRAKEQLILTTGGTRDADQWLQTIGCDKMDTTSNVETIEWGGAKWNYELLEVLAVDPEEQEKCEKESVRFDVLKTCEEEVQYKEKFVSPSKAKLVTGVYEIKGYDTFSDRLTIKAMDGKDSTIGDFFHHAMCLYSGDSALIASLAASYRISVEVDDVVKTINAFWQMMENTYGKATEILRETPFTFVNDEGQVVTGEIDLIYRTSEGDVLVDYKTYQGAIANLIDKNSDFYAGKYSGQILLYEKALKKNGSVIRDSLISYMSLGVTVKFYQI